MILIKGHGDHSKVEQLFPELNQEAQDQIEKLEESGFIVTIVNLPSHIETPEQYGMVQLDKFVEMYLPETEKMH